MPGMIVAYIGEDERYWPLAERAVQIAQKRGAGLIFYDVDAASAFSNPLPTWWSADGEEEQFESRLTPVQLEKAGREALRDRVQHARDQGVRAWGWLPSKRDAQSLAEYAAGEGASLLVVPAELEHRGIAGWLQGKPTADDIEEEAEQPVIVVDLEPEAAKR